MDIETRRLDKRIRKLIGTLATSDLAVGELLYVIPLLLERLKTLKDQPTHSKWYVEDQGKEIDKLVKLYLRVVK